MARHFSDDYITEVKEKNDIVSVISSYVNLKRSGSTMKGICPFHNEKTPSFSISPDKQWFHCFGCGKGGDVIDFVMDIESLDFGEAVTMLAEKAGMNLPEEQDNKNNSGEIKKLIYKINAEAGRFYYDCLIKDENCPAREYVKKRGLTKSTVNHFGIGYAPSGNAVLKHLRNLGYTDEQIISSGIVGKSENGDIYDRFRNRFMIPIIDQRKNIIGFGGRVLDDSKPKYLNSPETVAFNKSHNLFGLNFAKKSKENFIILVEGYMDVISLHQYGITSAVASLGTALTPEQARKIKNLKKDVIIAYDSDEAGQIATHRAIEILNEEDINEKENDDKKKVKVITIPGDKDPDDYIKHNGAGAFYALIDNAPVQMQYKIMKLKEKFDLANPIEKLDYINNVASEIANIKSPVELEIYITQISEETGINKEKIESEVTRLRPIKQKEKILSDFKQKKTKSTRETRTKEQMVHEKTIDAQKNILNLLCYNDELAEQILTKLCVEDFEEGTNRTLYGLLKEIRKNGDTPDGRIIVSDNTEISSEVSEIFQRTFDDPELVMKQALAIIFKDKKKRMISTVMNDDSLSYEERIKELNRIMESSTKESGSKE